MSKPTYTFRVIIEPDGKGYHGFVPLLRGVHASGRTVTETKRNLDEAVRCHVEGLLKDGETVPRSEESVEFVQSFVAHKLTLKAVYA